MKKRNYYSVRTGKLSTLQKVDLASFKKMFLICYRQLENEGFFQKYFGYYCVDQGQLAGQLGWDVNSIIFINLRKDDLWPITQKMDQYSEEDLFDMIEFLHDYCSQPLEGDYHRFNDCGYHYHTFDDLNGHKYFRSMINPILMDYKEGYELSDNGELLELIPSHLNSLVEANIPMRDLPSITNKVDLAVLKFRKHRSSIEERRDALRELADVLEFLRPQVKQVLMSSDESDLFNIANKFGIRHHNQNQKVDYDKPIFYSWIFYYYLASIHAISRLIERTNDMNKV